MNRRPVEWGPGGHRIVCRPVARIIRVRHAGHPAGLIAKLVGTVPEAVLEDGRGGNVSHADWRGGISRRVIWLKTQVAHQRVESAGLVGGEEVDCRAVSRVADRNVLVGQPSLSRRPAKSPTNARSDGVVVICGPSVVRARGNDGEGACNLWRPEPRVANALQPGTDP